MTNAVAVVHGRGGLARKSYAGDGFLSNVTITTIATDAAVTLTAAQLAGGLVVYSGFSAGRVITTDTAANILAHFSSMAIGDTKQIKVSILTAFAGTWAAGVGVTLAGRATTPASGSSNVYITKTSATTVLWTVL